MKQNGVPWQSRPGELLGSWLAAEADNSSMGNPCGGLAQGRAQRPALEWELLGGEMELNSSRSARPTFGRDSPREMVHRGCRCISSAPNSIIRALCSRPYASISHRATEPVMTEGLAPRDPSAARPDPTRDERQRPGDTGLVFPADGTVDTSNWGGVLCCSAASAAPGARERRAERASGYDTREEDEYVNSCDVPDGCPRPLAFGAGRGEHQTRSGGQHRGCGAMSRPGALSRRLGSAGASL
eukprot:scaffold699_cov385-Prasinococcus_capsulatus_cf.AAC.33